MSQKNVVVTTKSKSSALLKGLGLLGFSVVAMNNANAALETTELVATIGGATTAVAALATASLTVYVGIKVFKWIKTAI